MSVTSEKKSMEEFNNPTNYNYSSNEPVAMILEECIDKDLTSKNTQDSTDETNSEN